MKYLLLGYTPATAWDAATADTPRTKRCPRSPPTSVRRRTDRHWRVRQQRRPRPSGGEHHGPEDLRRGGGDRRPVRRAEGGVGQLRGDRRGKPRSRRGDRLRHRRRAGRADRDPADHGRGLQRLVIARRPSTCCAPRRRRSSARWSGASAASTSPRTQCRKRCSPRADLAGRRRAGESAQLADPDRLSADGRPARAPTGTRHRRELESGAAELAMRDPARTAGPATARPTTVSPCCCSCCHPALSATSQVALTLRAVGGLSDRRDRARPRDHRSHHGHPDQSCQTAVDPRRRPLHPADRRPTANDG